MWLFPSIACNKELELWGHQNPLEEIKVQGEFRWIVFTITFLEIMITLKFYEHSVYIPELNLSPFIIWGFI